MNFNGIEFLGIGYNLSLNFLLNFLRQVNVFEPQNEPNDVNDPHDGPYEENLDKQLCDGIDLMFIETEYVVDKSLGAGISEHFLDPYTGLKQFQ